MSSSKIASRYASALLELTKGQESTRDSLCESLQSLAAIYQDKSVKKVLSSPVVSSSLLNEVFSYALGKLTPDLSLRDLIQLLIINHRTALIPEISTAFYNKLQKERGIVDATVETALELKAEELAVVKAKLEVMLGKTVKLHSLVNPGLLGGFVVRVENNLIDMSLKTKLENMIKTAVS